MPLNPAGVPSMAAIQEAIDESTPLADSVFMPAPVSSVTVTFPVGHFATAPVVVATCTATGDKPVIANLVVTATGFTAYLYGVGGPWADYAVSMFWIAMDYS